MYCICVFLHILVINLKHISPNQITSKQFYGLFYLFFEKIETTRAVLQRCKILYFKFAHFKISKCAKAIYTLYIYKYTTYSWSCKITMLWPFCAIFALFSVFVTVCFSAKKWKAVFCHSDSIWNVFNCVTPMKHPNWAESYFVICCLSLKLQLLLSVCNGWYKKRLAISGFVRP